MLERYKETFDGIHASQRLKTEVLNMKREENVVKKRRIPATALVVAILVIVLAGTAVAVEHLGHVTILPMDQVPTGAKVNYAPAIIYGNCERIPVESLSDKVRAYAADMRDGVFKADIEFASLSECESFLGLELADNPLLEQQPWYEDGNPVPSTVSIFSRYQTPSELTVSSFYEVNGRRLNEFILLRTERAPEEDNYNMTSRWTLDEYEDYVTHSGMEVKIIAEEGEFGPGLSTCWAYFTRNNAIFSLTFSKENGDMDAMLDTMKEVLEAYE